ncbi:hypothetical protein [Microbacterium sp. 2MCAF23]|uniref:hypothetical protein n=1 Tax=Microbacterium sp. 2MCAF23 TaxID=3232985 RepID=UPI003F9DB074
MTTQTRVPATEVTGLYGAVVKFATKKMFGRVPDSIGVLWHHRPVFTDMMNFGRKTEKWHELDKSLSTLATMTAAATVGCSFCLDCSDSWVMPISGRPAARRQAVAGTVEYRND